MVHSRAAFRALAQPVIGSSAGLCNRVAALRMVHGRDGSFLVCPNCTKSGAACIAFFTAMCNEGHATLSLGLCQAGPNTNRAGCQSRLTHCHTLHNPLHTIPRAGGQVHYVKYNNSSSPPHVDVVKGGGRGGLPGHDHLGSAAECMEWYVPRSIFTTPTHLYPPDGMINLFLLVGVSGGNSWVRRAAFNSRNNFSGI